MICVIRGWLIRANRASSDWPSFDGVERSSSTDGSPRGSSFTYPIPLLWQVFDVARRHQLLRLAKDATEGFG